MNMMMTQVQKVEIHSSKNASVHKKTLINVITVGFLFPVIELCALLTSWHHRNYSGLSMSSGS